MAAPLIEERVEWLQIRFIAYLLLLFLCFVGGGGSRGDIFSLIYLRPAAAICLALFLFMPARIDWAAIRVPLWLLAGLTLWIALQLVPLPPALWTSLPGREPIAGLAGVLGVEQPWRPINMAPDLGLNSLAAMIIPVTALIGFGALSEAQRRTLLIVLIAGAVMTALWAVLQVSGSAHSAFYLYRVTNEGAAVGLFANRNHHAVFMALALPMLALWAAQARGDHKSRRIKRLIALAVAMFLVLMILVAGSRAGLLLGGAAAVWGVLQYLELRDARHGATHVRWKSLLIALGSTLGVGALLALVGYSRAESLQRLLGERFQGDHRFDYLPHLLDMIRTYFPFGSGFGSFDPLFRMREPFELLSPTYLNHAHNDLLELAITGGLPALALLIAFALWWARASWRAFRRVAANPVQRAYAMLGSTLILLMLLASLADYPLRTPILAFVFAISCGWLGTGITPKEQD